MRSRYDTEFNRTLPRQKEGPEFTDYLNPMGRRKKKKNAAVAAAVTTAAVVASLALGLFRGALSLLDVGATYARIGVDVSDRPAETAFTYVLYDGEEEAAGGSINADVTEIGLTGLSPDTPYRLILYAQGAPADSLEFKTLPIHGVTPPVPMPPEPVPVPQPLPVPQPDPVPGPDPVPSGPVTDDTAPSEEDPVPPQAPDEPDTVLREMTFDSLAAEASPDGSLVSVRPSYTLNDSVITGFEILLNGDLCLYTQESGDVYVIDASGYKGETVTISFTYLYTTGGSAGSVSRDASAQIPAAYASPALLGDIFLGSDFYIYPEAVFENEGCVPTAASFRIGDDTFTLTRADADSGSGRTVFRYDDGIDLSSYADLPSDPDELVTIPAAVSVTYTDPEGTERTEDYDVLAAASPSVAAYAERTADTEPFSIYVIGLPEDALYTSIEIYVSDSYEERGSEPELTVTDPVFTGGMPGEKIYMLDVSGNEGTYSARYMHAVITAEAFGKTTRIVVPAVWSD